MKLYRIVNWQAIYESPESRRIAGPLSWVRVPTKQDGFGFRRLTAQAGWGELFAAFVLMVEIAANQPQPVRGALMQDGKPLDADDLAAMTRLPREVFERALEFFISPKQGWMSAESWAGAGPAHDLPSAAPAPAHAPPSLFPSSTHAPPSPGPEKNAVSPVKHAKSAGQAHEQPSAAPASAVSPHTPLSEKKEQNAARSDARAPEAPLPSFPKTDAARREGQRTLPMILDVPEFREAWMLWCDYLADRQGRLPTQATMDAQLRFLADIAKTAALTGHKAAIEALEFAIRAGLTSPVRDTRPAAVKAKGQPPQKSAFADMGEDAA